MRNHNLWIQGNHQHFTIIQKPLVSDIFSQIEKRAFLTVVYLILSFCTIGGIYLMHYPILKFRTEAQGVTLRFIQFLSIATNGAISTKQHF